MSQGRAAAKAKPRLGRGLSSLIGEPVRVQEPEAHPAFVQTPPDNPYDAVVQRPNAAHTAAQAPDPTPEPDADDGARRLRWLPVGEIRPSPFQPRQHFDDAALEELAQSIRTAGVMQPVVVRRASDGEGHELIAGERRLRAARLAGLDTIPAVLSDVDDETAAEWGLVENLQRQDLGPIERGEAFRRLVDRFGMSHTRIAERLGIDRSSVTNFIRLTELEPEIQRMLAKNDLSTGHGKALLQAPAGEARVAIAERAASEGWTVRRVEQAARDAAEGKAVEAKRAAPAQKSANIVDLEKRLAEHLGTKVRVKTRAGGKKGSITLDFYDLDHFDGLMEKLGYRG